MNTKKVIAGVIVAGIFAWSLAIITLIASLLVAIPSDVINLCIIAVVVGCAVYLTLFIMMAISLRA